MQWAIKETDTLQLHHTMEHHTQVVEILYPQTLAQNETHTQNGQRKRGKELRHVPPHT